MRAFLAGLLIACLIAPIASAELLVTAMPFGQGRWVFEGAGISDANVANTTGMGASTLGAYLGYGLTDKLDMIVQAGQVTVTGLPIGISNLKTTGYGMNFKYAIATAGDSMPVDIAIGAGYKLLSQVTTITGLGDMTNNGNQMLLGIGISKLMVPFIPYAGFDYRAIGYNANFSSAQFNLTIGTAIAWSEQGAVFVEGTSQAIAPVGAAGYTSNQVALGVAYRP